MTAVLSNVVSNVPAVMLLRTLVPAFPDLHTGWPVTVSTLAAGTIWLWLTTVLF